MAIGIITGFLSSSREQLDKRSGPYTSVANALSALDTNSRVMGMPIYIIQNGTTDSSGNFTGGTVETYIFNEGILDSDFVKVATGAAYELIGTSVKPIAGTNTFSGIRNYSLIGGGDNNTISSYSNSYYSPAGGNEAILSGSNNIIDCNTSSGDSTNAFIGGGSNNTISSDYSNNSSIVSGKNNEIRGNNSSSSSIISGIDNEINSSNNSIISGGKNNSISNSYYATISGGINNTVSGYYASITGGQNNTSSGKYSYIGGGAGNTASAYYASVLGGSTNKAEDYYATVSGGQYNTASGYGSTVMGGTGNTASGRYSMTGGYSSTASGRYSYCIGYLNTTSGAYSSILSGLFNVAQTRSETILGQYNEIVETNSTITDWELSDRLFTVGGGDFNSTNNSTERRDLFNIYKNGNVRLRGNLTFDNSYIITSGRVSSLFTNRLLDFNASFLSDNISVGDEVQPDSTNQPVQATYEVATVVSIDSNSQITLSKDIFNSTTNRYIIRKPVNTTVTISKDGNIEANNVPTLYDQSSRGDGITGAGSNVYFPYYNQNDGTNDDPILVTTYGWEAGQNSDAWTTVFIGWRAGQNVIKSNSYTGGDSGNLVGIGKWALQNSYGSDVTGVGDDVGRFNKGERGTFVGEDTGYINIGDYNIGIGGGALKYNEGSGNIEITSDNDEIFRRNNLTTKSFTSSDVDPVNQTITINSHGFVGDSSYNMINLLFEATTAGKLANNKPYQFEVLDVNTLKLQVDGNGVFDALDGTEAGDLTAQNIYENTIIIGSKIRNNTIDVDGDNQIVLGNDDMQKIKTIASITSQEINTTGTRSGGDLVVKTGDYDDTGNGTSVEIDDSNGEINFYVESSLKCQIVTDGFISSQDITAPFVAADSFRLKEEYTVNTLPSGVKGRIAYVTDASSITYRGQATGGGSDFALVVYDGTNWIYH